MADSLAAAALAAAALVLIVCAARWTARKLSGLDRFTIDHARPVRSGVDGLAYRVHPAHAGAARAADALATINRRLVDLLRWLRARYVRGPDGERHPARRAAARRVLARYNPDNLAENSPHDPAGDTSYTVDKGRTIALCLRERGGAAALHDVDTVTFVALHEMGHIAVEELDHPPRFWSAFRFLLEEAEAAGVYRSPDFARSPRTYCGVHVNYNPRWDPATEPI